MWNLPSSFLCRLVASLQILPEGFLILSFSVAFSSEFLGLDRYNPHFNPLSMERKCFPVSPRRYELLSEPDTGCIRELTRSASCDDVLRHSGNVVAVILFLVIATAINGVLLFCLIYFLSKSVSCIYDALLLCT